MSSVTGLTAERMQEIIDSVDALEGNVPGTELAYAEMVSGLNTALVGGTMQIVSALSLVVVGQGRPVDVEWFIPICYHSVANTGINIAIASQPTGGALAYDQAAKVYSPKTTEGPSKKISIRKLLTLGQEYTFVFYFSGVAAGTSTIGAGGGISKMYSSVVSR